jgi:hypothetical protein
MSTEMGFDASTTDISSHLPGPHLTRSWRAFSCAAHHEPPLTAAAHSGLRPPPAGRSRRATQPPSLVQHRSQQTRHHSSVIRATFRVRVHKLRSHYRSISATTGRSAGTRRDGTQHLAVSAAWCAPSRSRHAAGAVSARAFPCFRTQAADRARATCTPGTAWPAIRAFRQAHPGTGIIAPVPMPFHPLDASAVVHSRSPSRSPPDGSHAAFSASLATAVFS